jgi:hypothetical protein
VRTTKVLTMRSRLRHDHICRDTLSLFGK